MEAFSMKDIVLLVLSTVIAVGIGVVGYSIRTLHRDIREKVKEAVNRTAQVERDFMDFKAQLPRQFVLKDDYIRTISVFEKKLDDINGNIIKLVKRDNVSEP